MRKNTHFLFLFMYLLHVVSPVSALPLKTIIEEFDNDAMVISADGVALSDGSLELEQNVLPDNDTNIIGCWQMEDASGSVVTDATGNHSGTCNNMDDTNWCTGVFGTGIQFDGYKEFVKILDDDALDGLNAFTVECWAKPLSQAYTYIPNPIVLFTMDDNNSTSLLDDTVNGFSGTLSSGTTAELSITGQIDEALEFDGSCYIEIDNETEINSLGDELTIAFWINASAVTGDAQHIISKGSDSDAYFDITLKPYDNDSNLLRITLNDSTCAVQPCYAVPAGEWAHVVISFNSETGSLKVYINGNPAQRVIDPRLLFYADYTEGKLDAEYSKGDGTAMYSAYRNTTMPATYCDKNGVIQKVLTNHTPRFTHGYYDETGFHYDYGLLIEKYSYNYAHYTEQFDNDVWVKSNLSVTANQVLAPDSTTTADLLEAENDNATILQFDNDSAVKNCCFSIFLKGAGSTDLAQITIDGVHWEDVTLSSTEWRRFQCYKTIANPMVGIRLPQLGDNVYVWGAQLEKLGYFATSYFPAESTDGYRSWDLLQYYIENNREPDNETMHIECLPEYFVNAANQLTYPPVLAGTSYYSNVADNRTMFLGSQNGKHFSFKPNHSVSPSCTIESYLVEIVKNCLYKVTATCQHSSPYAEGYVNGTKIGEELDNDYTPPSWDTDNVFCVGIADNGGLTFCGIIKNFVVFNQHFSAEEVSYINDFGIESFIGYDDVSNINSVANNNQIRIADGFVGKLDDFRIYDSSLTHKQAKAIYQEALGKNSSEPVLYYPFNDCSDNGFLEEVVNGYDAQCSTLAYLFSITGKVNDAFLFYNNTFHVEVDNNAEINALSDTLSISFWVYAPAVTGVAQHIISKKADDDAYFDITLEQYDASNNLMRVMLCDNVTIVQPAYLVPVNTWNYVTIALDGRTESSLKVYVNASQVQPLIDPRLLFYADYTEGTLDAEYSKGSGAATYSASRSSAHPATYCDNDGFIRTVAPCHIPRFTHGYYDETGFHREYGLLLEEETYNFALYSEEFDNEAWVKTNVTVDVDVLTAPDNDNTADKLTATTDNATILQTQTTSDDRNRCFSIFMKGTGSTDTVQIKIETTEDQQCKNVALSSTEWRRFQCYVAGSNPTISIQLLNAGDEVYVWGAQLEQYRFFATSYFPAVSTAVMRFRDLLDYSTANNREAATETIHIECVPEYFVNAANQLCVPQFLLCSAEDTTNGYDERAIFFGSQNGKHFFFRPNSTGSSSACYAVSYLVEIIKNLPYKVTCTCQHSAPYAIGYVNGTKIAEELDNDYAPPNFADTFSIGKQVTGLNFSGIMKNAVIFNSALSADEVEYINDYGVESFVGYDDVSNLRSIANSANIRIGEGLMNVLLDDIRVYDYALSQNEIAALFNNNNGTEAYRFVKSGIISKQTDSTSGSYALLSNTSPSLYTASGGTTLPIFSPPAENEWSHMAMVYDSNSLDLYINGALASSTTLTGTMNNSAADLVFGVIDNDSYWRGALDEVFLRNEALTAAQISDHARHYLTEGILEGQLCDIAEYIDSYDTVVVTLSNLSDGQSAYILFSNDGTRFYDNQGTENNGIVLSQGTNEIDLSSLGWSGCDFYYKIVLGSTSFGYIENSVSVDSIQLTYYEVDTEIDTDGDTLPDFDELHTYYTNPNAADTDGDGIDDNVEVSTPYYNPNVADPPVSYSEDTTQPEVNITECYEFGDQYIYVKGTSSNERPIYINPGSKEFLNMATGFSFIVKQSLCSISGSTLTIEITNADSKTAFSFDIHPTITQPDQFKIQTPPQGATISIKGE